MWPKQAPSAAERVKGVGLCRDGEDYSRPMSTQVRSISKVSGVTITLISRAAHVLTCPRQGRGVPPRGQDRTFAVGF